jgi:hypothetical protein
MKIMIKFFCLLLLIGFVGLFVLKGPDGKSWLNPASFVPDPTLIDLWPDELVSKLKNVTQASAPSPNSVAVYRWKNAEGIWVYSDTAPSEIKAELIDVSTNANGGLYPPVKKTQEIKNKIDSNTRPNSSVIPPSAKMETLVDDAKNVEALLQERKTEMDETLSLK